MSRETVSEGPQIDIALVDCFAALRTVYVAAQATRIHFVLSTAAEKCLFANTLARRNSFIVCRTRMSINLINTLGEVIRGRCPPPRSKSYLGDRRFPLQRALRRPRKVVREPATKRIRPSSMNPRSFWSSYGKLPAGASQCNIS